ncbi:DUF916 and DUF3324 domain-containing protein [Enterococcus sp. LJL120]
MKKSHFFIIAFVLFFLPVQTVAATGGVAVDYSIKAILPENQVNNELSYFDLRMEPNSIQTIEVQVNNFSDETQKYFVEVNTAQTNGNLLIDYGNSEIPENSPNQLPISEFIQYPKEIEIPPQKAGVVSFEINVPSEGFDGIKLAGIHIKKDFSKEDKNENQISSQYDYVLGLVVSENDNSVTPDIVFKGINPENVTNNAAITVQLENPTTTSIKNITMTGNIYLENSNTPMLSREITNGSVAPESVFDVFFFNGDTGTTKPLQAGEYLLELSLQDNQGNQWVFNEIFNITTKQAQQVNNQVFTTETDNIMLYVIIGILFALIFFGGIVILIKHNRKKQQQKRQLKKKKKYPSKRKNPVRPKTKESRPSKKGRIK